MKAVLLLLVAVVIDDVTAIDLTKAVENREKVPNFEFMGYTDLNVVEVIEGVASGLFKKDVRE